MKTCRTCKHNKKPKNGDAGECVAWSRDEWIALTKKLPVCFSCVKISTIDRDAGPCAYYVNSSVKQVDQQENAI